MLYVISDFFLWYVIDKTLKLKNRKFKGIKIEKKCLMRLKIEGVNNDHFISRRKKKSFKFVISYNVLYKFNNFV
jgi:hypothetical protein